MILCKVNKWTHFLRKELSNFKSDFCRKICNFYICVCENRTKNHRHYTYYPILNSTVKEDFDNKITSTKKINFCKVKISPIFGIPTYCLKNLPTLHFSIKLLLPTYYSNSISIVNHTIYSNIKFRGHNHLVDTPTNCIPVTTAMNLELRNCISSPFWFSIDRKTLKKKPTFKFCMIVVPVW